MSEKSIVEALSGTEVVEAIKHRVGQILSRDCFLSGNMAYESFEAKIHISIKCKDIGHSPEIEQTITAKGGPDIGVSYKDPVEASRVESDELEDEMDSKAPNEVRVESDQPVPILVENADGRAEIKRVHYARSKPPRTDPNPASGYAENLKLPDAND